MIFNELLYVAFIPLAVAASLTLLAKPARLNPTLTWATAVALAYVTGQIGLALRAGDSLAQLLRPHEAVDWLPFAVLAALGVTTVTSMTAHPWRRLAIGLAVALTIALPLRLLHGSAYDLQWTLAEKLTHIALLAAALGLTWLLLASPREDDHPRLRPILLIVVVSTAAVIVSLSGVFVYGELCGVLAAALTGAFLASRSPCAAGSAGVVTFSLGSLILLAYFYAELTATNAALLLLATWAAAGPMPPFLQSSRAWQNASLRTLLTLVPLAIALAQTIAANQAAPPANPYAI
jgi:hypothetical protein